MRYASQSNMEKKETNKKTEHSSIYAALAAFQLEAPKVDKTKRFGKEGEAMSFMYASLDDVYEKALPIAAKHGIAVVTEGEGDSMVVALYHTTYETKEVRRKTKRTFDGTTEDEEVVEYKESGVIRSLPIKVTRAGDMKKVGADSTYARRYMTCELLGIAPDEDKDYALTEASSKNAKKFAYSKAKQGVQNAKTKEDLLKATKILQDDLSKLRDKKAPAMGLSEDEYVELLDMAEARAVDLE